MRKNKVNNDHRRTQADRYGKYVIAAKRLGYHIPTMTLDDAVVWLSKQDDVKVWPSICAEAARLFPETFQQQTL